MSPSETQTTNNQAAQSSGATAPQAASQPASFQPMDPQRPHPEQPEFGNLRGGERSSLCPGRFCFIIPCPLPCDFCVI
ncbi:hypothetical protein F4821DRAFT_264050 [Hypoxylon rubiginosum]|uniref:Uncharacterized protein n=1 Tax=Hypoxylon rubiginosum TaxID=110542 RepID=A0ACC0CPQ8_9PEZI|nr:hypothetical protein F4821DRAFT_264050 [Hypoxylon rubiginosum]